MVASEDRRATSTAAPMYSSTRPAHKHPHHAPVIPLPHILFLFSSSSLPPFCASVHQTCCAQAQRQAIAPYGARTASRWVAALCHRDAERALAQSLERLLVRGKRDCKSGGEVMWVKLDLWGAILSDTTKIARAGMLICGVSGSPMRVVLRWPWAAVESSRMLRRSWVVQMHASLFRKLYSLMSRHASDGHTLLSCDPDPKRTPEPAQQIPMSITASSLLPCINPCL